MATTSSLIDSTLHPASETTARYSQEKETPSSIALFLCKLAVEHFIKQFALLTGDAWMANQC